jgi:hypothetical protein
MDSIELKFSQAGQPPVTIALSPRADDGVAAGAYDEIAENSLHNDICYDISLNVENAAAVNSVDVLINDEITHTRLCREDGGLTIVPTDEKRIFRDCFGVAQIVCVVGDVFNNKKAYASKNIPIMVRDDAINRNVINMVDFIYKHGERYLHGSRKDLAAGINADGGRQNSIEAKLNIIRHTLDIYKECYAIFIKSPKKKLINDDVVGSFEKLGAVTFKTIRYIVSHPEELVSVNHSTGININKQYFQPRNTLVSTTVFSDDVYENRVAVGFLKTIIRELKNLDKQISALLSSQHANKFNAEYINSMAYVYARSESTLENYLDSVRKLRVEFEKMYFAYSGILTVSHLDVVALPEYTRVFQSIKAYQLIYKRILEWFSRGNYSIENDDLIFRFVSTSKIYEYYCLIKINECLTEHLGYGLKGGGYMFKYPQNRYGIRYNNTFEFVHKSSPDVCVTVYFQPVVFGKGAGKNGLLLFRNTHYSAAKSDLGDVDDDEPGSHGNFYNPDFVFKVVRNGTVKYFILDAKFSTADTVAKRRLPGLVFKYLFSISTINPADSVSGICFICGKGDGADRIDNIYTNAMRPDIMPSAKLITVSGVDVDDYRQIGLLLRGYVSA